MAAQVVGSQGRVLAIEVGHTIAVTYTTLTYYPMTYHPLPAAHCATPSL